MPQRRIGIDTGGTFTDVVTLNGSRLEVHKVPSTPRDPGQAVLDGLGLARRGDEPVDVVHGTTVGLNAVLTGNLARVAFITNEGFEDLIEIGRQERTDLYDLQASRAEVPVPRHLRFGVPTRRAADGTQTARPTRAALKALRERVAKARPEAIAIGLLHSYAHPEDEEVLAAAVRSLGIPVTCSATLLPGSGEFERFVACILNAAIRPNVSTYLQRLAKPVQPGRLRLMRSSGGIMSGEEAATFPARAMFSGPAGGVLATRALAKRAGFADVAALDMGGTSTDVCLVQQETTVSENTIAGLPLAIPSVEVHTVGCGGGSIARVDAGGALRVGPESAGADPGPACYGRGERPTVTDAHVVLGHIGAETLLAGAFPVDPDRSVHAVQGLARQIGTSTRKAAAGILEIAEIHMMRALLVITVQRAIDPAQVPLVAFGGAGGLHAAALRRLLDMPSAVVPAHPGAFSAVGLALAGESVEVLEPVLKPLASLSAAALDRRVAALTRTAAKQLDGEKTRVQATVSLRYAGQGASLTVPLRHPLAKTLAACHLRLFGFVPQGRDLEVVEIRVRLETPSRPLPIAPGRKTAAQPKPREHRRPPVGGPSWPVYPRRDLPLGLTLTGPCLIEEATGVTVVPKDSVCATTKSGLSITALSADL